MTKSAYQLPEIYEIAFGFRDHVKAVDFIVEACRQSGLDEIELMVDLGCGPGQYCREFARRSIPAWGVDNSPQMIAYASEKCLSEKLPCELIEADIRRFSLPRPVSLAVCMMDSLSCLLTNQDLLENFDSVSDNLADGGIYLIELTHPRDIFSVGQSTRNNWEIEHEGTRLEIDWCSDGIVDPLTEIASGTVKFHWHRGGETESYQALHESRNITLGLLRSLIDRSERFKIAAMYGDLDVNQPFDNTKKSWRMIVLLRKY